MYDMPFCWNEGVLHYVFFITFLFGTLSQRCEVLSLSSILNDKTPLSGSPSIHSSIIFIGETMFNFLYISGAIVFALFVMTIFTFPLFAIFVAVGYFAIREIVQNQDDDSMHWK